MKRKCFKLQLGTALVITCLFTCFTISVFASSSISDLHDRKEQVSIVNKDSKAAELLADHSLYSSIADSNDYRSSVADIIEKGRSTSSRSGENGRALIEDIPTVKEMLVNHDKEAPVDLDLLDQLTFFCDLKYVDSGKSVLPGEMIDGKLLENGPIEIAIDGGEITRSADINDFLIILIDAQNGNVHYLPMKDYDSLNGRFTVEFPCLGPYMITQVMK